MINIRKSSEIAREMFEVFIANQEEIDDILPGTPEHDLIEKGFAETAEELYRAIAISQDDFYINAATGEALDKRAADYDGLTRKAAIAAQGSITVTGSAGSTVPLGTRVRRPPTSGSAAQEYTTDVAATIKPGDTTASIPVTADTEGVVGNAAPNTIVEFVAGFPAGITAVTNPLALDSGTDRESDESLRQAIQDFLDSRARSTVHAIEFEASRVEGVFRAAFLENQPSAGRGRLIIDVGSVTSTDAIVGTVRTVIQGDGSEQNRGYLPAGTKISVETFTGTDFDDEVAPEVADPALQRFNIPVYIDEAA